MVTIEVDFEVFKALTARRRDERYTENDVIRDLLGLTNRKQIVEIPHPISANGAWVCKGVTFPEGTKFRAKYRGEQHTGVVRNGYLIVNGTTFHSPSGAATEITRHAVNGWQFWECLLPGGDEWTTISKLRRSA